MALTSATTSKKKSEMICLVQFSKFYIFLEVADLKKETEVQMLRLQRIVNQILQGKFFLVC